MAYSLVQQKKASKIETLSQSRYFAIFQGHFLLYEKKILLFRQHKNIARSSMWEYKNIYMPILDHFDCTQMHFYDTSAWHMILMTLFSYSETCVHFDLFIKIVFIKESDLLPCLQNKIYSIFYNNNMVYRNCWITT